jgi:hypothetical protein
MTDSRCVGSAAIVSLVWFRLCRLRLNPRREDLHRWRETFAEKLQGWGIEAEASSQATRGVTRRSLRGWERQPGAAARTGKKRGVHKTGPAAPATRSGALKA